ncbi:ATPase [Lymphocystis disease virus 4]|uniref:ATPase n=2 Tax=Lymphocystivirus TaxID=10494 RepID=A0A6B9XI36_9VIRU|nr:ATPase [Lymphocystis disease virus 4]QHR78440.1 ATPase [Lymphocystis disease virus 4]
MEALLRNTRVGKGQIFTHVSMDGGKYLLDAYRYPMFWQATVDSIQPLHLLETRYKESPLTLDFDIKEPRKIYDKDTLKKLHVKITKYLKEYLLAEDRNLIGVFLHKPFRLLDDGTIKQSFHVHYPRIMMNVVDMQKLTQELKPECESVMKKDYLDPNGCKVCWFVYGACKPGDDPYTIKYVFDALGKTGDFHILLKDTLYPRCFGETNDPHTLIRFYLTIMPQDKEPYLISFKNIKPKLIDKILYRKAEAISNEEVRPSKLKYLIDLLPDECADDRDVWLETGFCIWQVTDGSVEGYNIWTSFSKRSNKYDTDECFNLWYRQMRPNDFTIASLYWLIKKYNPEGFADYVRLYECPPSKYYTDGSHVGVAKIVHHHFGSEFKCVSVKNHVWYRYDGVTWTECHVGVDLRRLISDSKAPILQTLDRQIKTVVDSLNGEETDERYAEWQAELAQLTTEELEKMIDRLFKIKKSLRMTQFKNSVMRECEELFFDPLFAQKIDSDPYLIAFKNGVFDFKQKTFRPGRPEDYCCKKLSVDYVDYGLSGPLSCDPSDFNRPELKEVLLFFQHVFPDVELRTFFIRQLASAFVGGNSDKICLFWTGSGNNGKTVTQNLIEKMFGVFAVKLSTSVLTGKKPSTGQANPELVRTGGGVRWAVMEEPDNDERINAGILKNLTGNDTFWARDLYCAGKDTKEITPMFKLHIICNNLPEIKYADQAVWNRVRVIPFESVFKSIEECPETYEDRLTAKTFPVDVKFNEKLCKMTEPLAYYLIYYWLNMDRLNYNAPDKVLKATKEYRNENDLYKQFVDNNLMEEKGTILSDRLLYIKYKEWLNETHPYYIVPPRNKAIKKFVDVLGPLNEGTWMNFNFV